MISVPFYQLTRHAQAKRLRLSVDTLGNIKVTAPRRVSTVVIDEFVKDNLDWIRSTRRQNRDARISHPDLGLNLPQAIHLKAMQKTLQISSLVSDKLYSALINEVLYLYGPTEKARLNVLRLWIKSQARQFLGDELALQAKLMGLSYNRVFIKNQKTRWGSCSSRKNINLNQNLIFVEKALVNYLLIHELSHLVHPNHSHKFWQHVENYDRNYRTHDQALNRMTKQLPLWALPTQTQ